MRKSRRRDVFGCHVNLFVSTFGDRAKNGRKTGVGWAIGSNNLTSWSQLTPTLCWVGAVFVLQTALATRNGQSRLQKRPAQQNRASRMAFEDIALAFFSSIPTFHVSPIPRAPCSAGAWRVGGLGSRRTSAREGGALYGHGAPFLPRAQLPALPPSPTALLPICLQIGSAGETSMRGVSTGRAAPPPRCVARGGDVAEKGGPDQLAAPRGRTRSAAAGRPARNLR